MIARVWSAQTTEVQAPNYVEHLKTQVLPRVRTLDGFAGAMLLERAIPGAVEICECRSRSAAPCRPRSAALGFSVADDC